LPGQKQQKIKEDIYLSIFRDKKGPPDTRHKNNNKNTE